MPAPRVVRCHFCGDTRARTVPPWRQRLCPSCEPLARPLLTVVHEPGLARELMISRHAGEPRRKLLELATHSVVVFFTDSLEIFALEIETKPEGRVLRWSLEAGDAEFAVRNLGNGYDNRDELIPARGFDRARLFADIATAREVLSPALLRALEQALGPAANGE